MMKKITSISLLLMFSIFASGQYSYIMQSCNNQNPGDLNNDVESFPLITKGYNKILGGSSVPIWSPVQTIPFTFNFNGNNFTEYKVSTTGILTFDIAVSAVPDSNNVELPSTLIPDNSICVWGITARPGAWNDSIGTKTFGTAPYRQHWVWFCSFSRAGSTGTGYTYWSIVLEETTNKIYIVDQRTAPAGSLSMTIGIQIDSATAYQVAGSPNVISNVITTNTGKSDPSDNVYYEFSTSHNQYDIRAKTLTLASVFPYKALSSGPFPISGTLANLGSENLSDITLNYSVDGGPPVSSPPISANVLAGRCYNYNHPTTWSPLATGWHQIKFWVSDLNGYNDQDNSNDTLYAKVFVYDNTPNVHKVVVEEATGTWCGWCPRGTVYMDSISHAHPNSTVLIAVHGGYSSEPMRVATYDAGVSAAVPGHPHILVNRVFKGDPSTVFTQYNAHVNDFGLADVDVAVNYNGLNRQAEVTGTITSAVDADGDYRLICVYTEDGVTGPGDGSNANPWDYDQQNYYSVAWHTANGTTPPATLIGAGLNWSASSHPVSASLLEYDFVARNIQGGYRGQAGSLPASLTSGGVYTYTFPIYTIPAGYNPANMKAHIFLYDYENDIIMNANSKPLINVGLSDPEKGKYSVSVFPNPATNQLYVDLNFVNSDQVNLTVTDLMGKVCLAKEVGTLLPGEYRIPLDITKLSSGTYFVSLIGKSGIATTKFIK